MIHRLILLTLLFIPYVYGLQITEIMHNPEGSDNNKEFIEVLVGNVSLENMSIADSQSNDTLILLKKGSGPYALIVEEGFNTSAHNCTLYSAGAAIGNGLSVGDIITLANESATIIDSANGNGYSLEYSTEWKEGETYGGTPCAAAREADEGDGEIHCASILTVDTDAIVYTEDESVTIYNTLISPPKHYHIEYWVESIDGTVVKKKRNTTNTKPKSWSPKYDGVTHAYRVRNKLHPSCDNESISTKVIVTAPTQQTLLQEENNNPSNESALEFVAVSDDHIEYGETVMLEFSAYRGVTRKRTVYAFIEKEGIRISHKTRVSLKHQFTSQNFEIPITLFADCSKKQQSGDAQLILEGIDVREELPISISGHNERYCTTITHTIYKNITQKHSVPHIRSWYTRKKKITAEESIKVFATIESKKPYNAWVIGPNTTKQYTNVSNASFVEHMRFPAGKHRVHLLVHTAEHMDSAQMVLDVEGVQHNITSPAQHPRAAIHSTPQTIPSTRTPTGAVIALPDTEKRMPSPLLLICVLVVLLGALFKLTKKDL